jgi:hypothetical protein
MALEQAQHPRVRGSADARSPENLVHRVESRVAANEHASRCIFDVQIAATQLAQEREHEAFVDHHLIGRAGAIAERRSQRRSREPHDTGKLDSLAVARPLAVRVELLVSEPAYQREWMIEESLHAPHAGLVTEANQLPDRVIEHGFVLKPLMRSKVVRKERHAEEPARILAEKAARSEAAPNDAVSIRR